MMLQASSFLRNLHEHQRQLSGIGRRLCQRSGTWGHHPWHIKTFKLKDIILDALKDIILDDTGERTSWSLCRLHRRVFQVFSWSSPNAQLDTLLGEHPPWNQCVHRAEWRGWPHGWTWKIQRRKLNSFSEIHLAALSKGMLSPGWKGSSSAFRANVGTWLRTSWETLWENRTLILVNLSASLAAP